MQGALESSRNGRVGSRSGSSVACVPRGSDPRDCSKNSVKRIAGDVGRRSHRGEHLPPS